MAKLLLFLFVLIPFLSCNNPADKKAHSKDFQPGANTAIYSKNISDSFMLSVHLPEGYDKDGKNQYPVVYLLDANLYFDMLAATLDKYAQIGLTKPVIIAGIGYKNLEAMDSLRCRDYTYPVAIPEYEMQQSGGACKFQDFIEQELTAYIDSKYKTDTTQRILAGHSLGGYFTLFAFLQQSKKFNKFIAASPSLHYNRYYLLEQFGNLHHSQKAKTYIAFGGLEDKEENDSSLLKTSEAIKALQIDFGKSANRNIIYSTCIFSGLGHMDTPIPAFIKGLQFILGGGE